MARADLDEIWLNIALDNEIHASNFLELIWSKFPLIALQPRMGVARDDIVDGIRCLPFRDYLIFYRLQSYGIEIARVMHGAQDIGQQEF